MRVESEATGSFTAAWSGRPGGARTARVVSVIVAAMLLCVGVLYRSSEVDGSKVVEETTQPLPLARNGRYTAAVARDGTLEVDTQGVPFRLKTRRACRSGACDGDPSTPELAEDGSVVRRFGAIVERFRGEASGVEQSWELATMPRGNGDLDIELDTSGYRFANFDARGAHYVDASSGRMLTYGAAVWIDAAGRRTSIALSASDSGIALRVPSSLLDESVYPAVLDPTIGPELAMDAPIAPGPMLFSQLNAEAVYDGTNYVIVWPGQIPSATSYNLLVARVDTSGAALDPAPIVLTPSGVVRAKIASNGSNVLIVWTSTDAFIHIQILSGGATIASKVLTPSSNARSLNVDVAFDGTNYLVVWTQSGYLVGERISPAGVELDPGGLSFMSGRGDPALACNGTYCMLLSITSASQIYGARIDKTGTLLDNPGFPVSVSPNGQGGRVVTTSKSWGAAIASDGNKFLEIFQSPAVPTLTGVVFDSSGTISTTVALESPQTNLSFRPFGVAFDGTEYKVASGLSLTRVSTAGAILGVPNSRPGQVATVACATPSCLFLWNDAPDFDRYGAPFIPTNFYQIYASRVSAQGNLLDPNGTLVSRSISSSNTQRKPAAASDGTHGLVVWQDDRALSLPIYGAFPPSSPFLIAAQSAFQTRPAVTFVGTNALVVWEQADTTIAAVRVNVAGAVLDAPIVLSALGASMPAVAFDGTNALAAWYRGGAIEVALVSPSGAPTPPNAVLTGSFLGALGLASNGTKYFLASSGTGALLDSGGKLLTSFPIPYKQQPFDLQGMAASSNGNDFLVVGINASGVFASSVTAAGVVGAENDVSRTTLTTDSAAVSYSPDTGDYFVAWHQHDTNGGGEGEPAYGNAVSPAGVPRSIAPQALLPTKPYQFHPTIAALKGGSFLVAYERWIQSDPFNTLRVEAITVDFGVSGVADAGVDAASPDAGGGVDAGSLEAGLDATTDADGSSTASDAADLDAAEDAELSDARAEADGGDAAFGDASLEGGAPADASAPVDAAQVADAAQVRDAARIDDAQTSDAAGADEGNVGGDGCSCRAHGTGDARGGCAGASLILAVLARRRRRRPNGAAVK